MTTDKTLLTRYPLLRILPSEQFDVWLAAGQDVDSPSGVMIFQENTDGAWVYLIREGRVRILRQSGTREVTLGMLQAGDLFGEYALLPPGRNTATCRTAAPSQLRRLPLAPLRTALQGLKPVWRNLKPCVTVTWRGRSASTAWPWPAVAWRTNWPS